MERRLVRGVHFIRVKGTSTERARQHGALLKDEIRAGALAHLAKKNEWLIRRGPGAAQLPGLQGLVVWFYHRVLLPYLHRRNPEEIRSVMRAMSEAAGIPYSTMVQSLFQPDGLMLLCRMTIMKRTLGNLPATGMLGCTSAVTLKEWTRDGKLLACRNQDYPMVGPWEPNTTVIFHEPTEKDQLPHVGVTTAGVHTAGLTAMNREGLTLFTHAHFGRNVCFDGMPVVDIGNEIIRKARSLGQAVDIARGCKPYSNWSFIVSSARENDAVVIEMTPRRMEVRHAEGGFLAHTNYFHSPGLQAEEARISGSFVEDVMARVCRIRQVLEPDKGMIEPRHMASVLGDAVDRYTGEERVVGNTLSVVTTVKSTVWEPETQRLWISTRGESPMGLGDFAEVEVDRFWRKGAEEAELPVLPGYRPRATGYLEGMRHYREAYRAFHMQSEMPDYLERTLAALRKATRAFPSDGHLWVQAAIVAFRAHEFREARECLERTSGLKLSPHTAGVRDLYLARCRDIAGERSDAVALYCEAEKRVADPCLREALARGRKRPYRAHETSRMLLDLQFPDTLHY